jgi:hypothetical protein
MEESGVNEPSRGLAIKLSKWLNAWWDRLAIFAPKKVCPNCLQECSDLQVIDCYTSHQEEIRCNAGAKE